MLALRCPHCNAVAPVPLSARDALRCDACGGQSELPEAARRQLEVADMLLRSTDPAKRKLSRTQADALTSARTGRKVLWALHGVFLFAASIWSLGGIITLVEGKLGWDEMLLLCSLSFLPLLTVVFFAWRGASRLTARREALAEKCAASPPAVPGAPLRCRVCAAPIQSSSGTEKVADCGYCGADNLIDKKVLLRAVRRQKELTADLEAEVRAALTDVSAAARSAYVQALKSAVLAPVISLGAGLVVVLVLSGIHLEVDRSVEYAVVRDEGRPCIARVLPGGTQLELRRGEEALDVVHRALAPSEALERSDATRFVGRVLRDPTGKEWKLKEVKRKLGGRNIALFDEAEAPPWLALEAFCLVGAP
jgi:hypothetical protein